MLEKRVQQQACKYDSNINICLRYWAPTAKRGGLTSAARSVPLFYMDTILATASFFAHSTRLSRRLVRVSADSQGVPVICLYRAEFPLYSEQIPFRITAVH
jgi:hypothetical protein